jgi:hypothetical protein
MSNVRRRTGARIWLSLAVTAALAAACGGASARTVPARQAPPTRPNLRSERIPAGARRVVVSTTRFGKIIQGPTTVTSARAVSSAVSLLDALRPFPPGIFSCPADFGLRIRLALYRTVAGSSSTPPLAVAVIDPDGCGEVHLTVSGRQRPALAGSRALVRRLSAVLHIKLDSGPS